MSKEEDLAYADGYYDGLRHGKQSATRSTTMADESPTTESQRTFDSQFKYEQSNLRGSEEEIIIYKQNAWRWYQLGRDSLRKEVQQKLISHVKDFDERFE